MSWHSAIKRLVLGRSSYGMRMRMLLMASLRNRPAESTKVIYSPVMPKADTVCPRSPAWTRSSIPTSLGPEVVSGQEFNSACLRSTGRSSPFTMPHCRRHHCVPRRAPLLSRDASHVTYSCPHPAASDPCARRPMSGVTEHESPEKRHMRPYKPFSPLAPGICPKGSLPLTAINTALFRVPLSTSSRCCRDRGASGMRRTPSHSGPPCGEGGGAVRCTRQPTSRLAPEACSSEASAALAGGVASQAWSESWARHSRRN
mmetsp:Transcript_9313/g.27999  ORF Transcript_9313/g.27999 Transcript_9313/m.27999 type:complete len:258 (-) Transcript_9313:71-844(-)